MIGHLTVIGAASLLAVFSVLLTADGQIPPTRRPLPTVVTSGAKETYNDCDKRVLNSNPSSGECAQARPPLNSGDGLGLQSYYINTNPTYLTAHLIAHPNRPGIVDSSRNIVIIRGEAFAVSALFFGKDANTLTEVIRNTQVQAATSNGWVAKRTLGDGDHGEISNLRRYQISDCGKALTAVGKDLASFEKLSLLAQAGLEVTRRRNAPMPSPSSLIKATPSGPSLPPQDGLRTPGRGALPGVPSARDRDQLVFQEMADAAMEHAVKGLEAAARGAGTCPAKTLPYYWTAVYFQYSPAVGENQLRLHVNSVLVGTKDVTLTGSLFKVYPAAATRFEAPTKDGSRDFSFQVFAAGDLNLTGRTSVAYNQGTLSSVHRSSATLGANAYTVTINQNTVKQVTASGRFPFTRSYWDDVALKDVTETVTQNGDSLPIVINGGARVAYRMETADFVSLAADFTMPPPLTLALMGDSFSAGQGAPMLAPYNAWLDDNCHRSRYSGMYRAVNRFIKASNKATDYVFRACEGATIQDMLDQAQRAKHEPDGTVKPGSATFPNQIKQEKPQIDLVKDWMTSKSYARINVAVFGIGGNNVAFADVIQAAILSLWSAAQSAAMHKQVDAGFVALTGPNGYRRLDAALKSKLNVENVIVFGYPDLIHDVNGGICRTDCGSPGVVPHTIQQQEFEYGNTILIRLNDAAKLAGKMPGWRYADVILKATDKHGICVCNDNYFTTWDDASSGALVSRCSIGIETGSIPLGKSCSFHPSARGYEQYITPVLRELNALHGK